MTITTESLERLAVLYSTAAIAGDSKRMNEVGDELRRRDEAVEDLRMMTTVSLAYMTQPQIADRLRSALAALEAK